MDVLNIALVLMSAILHTYWNFELKKTIEKGAGSMLLYWMSSFVAMIFYLPFVILLVAYQDITINFSDLLYPAICGFFMALYMLFLSKAYKEGDMSKVYPLTRTTPLFTLVIGIFYLGEPVTIAGISGVLLILAGMYFLHLKKLDFQHILRPVNSLFKNNASRFAILTAFMTSLYGLMSKLGGQELNPFVFTYIAFSMAVFFYSPVLLFQNSSILSHFKYRVSMLKIGVLDLLGYSLIVFALGSGNLSYIFALRQVNILFSTLVGVYVLKEKYGKIRGIASGILFIGVVLVSFS
jgi:uncharacterized membrane protein